ncbi:purine and uridine phosphorylase [Aspergillus heteromorphus CBS 117.55]|uniref:Purine and uridine phosphorylase n=1 Tax=Aspergillus heteromorphus CBS 117.55 TaxID=1448321 RepID=A0A317WN28_9EURO|nr:purine and uridine phosphorylase [Aspergillus heteromorphus CBS 117.55]PWY86682.1 purine and uridine phosphorylase [Aspergillus heteromorphus CBS 117.55]
MLAVMLMEVYTVGWICALHAELTVAKAMLDEEHDRLPQDLADKNTCLPAGVIGTISAAAVANRMLLTFPSLRLRLMVGIGGGAPGERDIRLGDVVAGIPSGPHRAVLQYDFGKTIRNGELITTGSLNRPPDVLLTAVNILKSEHTLRGNSLSTSVKEMPTRFPLLRKDFSYPGFQQDTLYEAEYDHPGDDASCERCQSAREVRREPRPSPDPVVHYGLIASGNQVMKHGPTRNRIRRDHKVLCFEMEAASLMDEFPCLVIRGISDYSDSHKNKD